MEEVQDDTKKLSFEKLMLVPLAKHGNRLHTCVLTLCRCVSHPNMNTLNISSMLVCMGHHTHGGQWASAIVGVGTTCGMAAEGQAARV